MAKTVKELRESVLSYGFNTRTYSSLINHWIDEAQRNIFREAGLRKKAKEKEYTATVGKAEYELPTDFANSISLRDLAETSDKTLRRIINIEEYDDAQTEEGTPLDYIINGNNIILYPTPNSARKYSLRYNRIPSAIAEEEGASPEIGEDYFFLIELYCLYKAFQKEGDIEMANHYKGTYDTEMVSFRDAVNTDTKDSVEQVEGAWGPTFSGSN